MTCGNGNGRTRLTTSVAYLDSGDQIIRSDWKANPTNDLDSSSIAVPPRSTVPLSRRRRSLFSGSWPKSPTPTSPCPHCPAATSATRFPSVPLPYVPIRPRSVDISIPPDGSFGSPFCRRRDFPSRLRVATPLAVLRRGSLRWKGRDGLVRGRGVRSNLALPPHRRRPSCEGTQLRLPPRLHALLPQVSGLSVNTRRERRRREGPDDSRKAEWECTNSRTADSDAFRKNRLGLGEVFRNGFNLFPFCAFSFMNSNHSASQKSAKGSAYCPNLIKSGSFRRLKIKFRRITVSINLKGEKVLGTEGGTWSPHDHPTAARLHFWTIRGLLQFLPGR